MIKYKKIIKDDELAKKVRQANTSEVARKVGVSKQYMYAVLNENYTITEQLYEKIKEVMN